MNNFFKPGLSWKNEDIDKLINKYSFFKEYTTLGYITNNLVYKYDHLLQIMPKEYNTIWSDVGVVLDESTDHYSNQKLIDSAFEFIKKNDGDSIGNTIKLIRSLHIIKSTNKDNDVSFSDPKLPFSVFISIPTLDSKHYIERLVENIIHESLHLQLTLIEKHETLYNVNQHKIYSPWKNEPRNNVGIMHAVYVFSKLKHFWDKVRVSNSIDFSSSRVKAIDMELKKIEKSKIEDFYSEKGNSLLSSCLIPALQ
ncbi:MAG: aKG-HExxH-type peptide beta-hydroxylase [Thiolinea sp.]